MAMATELDEISSSSSSKFNWKIKNFSNFPTISTDSDVFSVGTFKWKARIYPKGKGKVYDHLSLFLLPAVEVTKTMVVESSFAITSQTDRNNTVKKGGKDIFLANSAGGWGWPEFMPPAELHDPSKGYIVDDTCIITVEVTCWMKEEEEDTTLKENDPPEVPEAKRTKIKDERQVA